MGLFNEALDAITADICDKLDDDVDVRDHPGRFTDDELSQIVTRKRKSVRIAIEELPALEVQGTGIRQAEARFIAFVLCSDGKGSDRHRAALDLIEDLSGIIVFSRWGNREMFRAVEPGNIVAENLYSGEVSNGKGLAWWSISWSQVIKNP